MTADDTVQSKNKLVACMPSSVLSVRDAPVPSVPRLCDWCSEPITVSRSSLTEGVHYICPVCAQLGRDDPPIMMVTRKTMEDFVSVKGEEAFAHLVENYNLQIVD